MCCYILGTVLVRFSLKEFVMDLGDEIRHMKFGAEYLMQHLEI